LAACRAAASTRVLAITERPHDVSCLSVVSFNIPSTYSAVFLLLITAASDLLVHKILLSLGYPMVKNFDATHEHGEHTDRQTPHNSIGRDYASHRAAKTSSASHVNFHSFVAFMCLFRSEIF